MQINRMFEIVHLLLRRDSLTAGQLAQRLGVSTRTIYRDIEALSLANIPVYADRGKGGGIRLLPGFAVSKSMLTEQEQDDVLSALQMLRLTGGQDSGALVKLQALFRREQKSWVDVDFSDWGGSDERFELLKRAILERLPIAFDYSGSNGAQSSREAEPLQLYFKHRSWYLKAFCRTRQDYRLFKCARMRGVRVLADQPAFERELPDDGGFGASMSAPAIEFWMRIDASQRFRVYEEFAEWQIEPQPDGSLVVRAHFVHDEWVYGYVLGYGEYAEILAPESFRDEIRRRLQKTLNHYL